MASLDACWVKESIFFTLLSIIAGQWAILWTVSIDEAPEAICKMFANDIFLLYSPMEVWTNYHEGLNFGGSRAMCHFIEY